MMYLKWAFRHILLTFAFVLVPYFVHEYTELSVPIKTWYIFLGGYFYAAYICWHGEKVRINLLVDKIKKILFTSSS